MPVNEIKPFGTADGANVLSPADYAESAFRQQGFENGIAEAYEANTVFRQASFVAAMIGQFTAENSGFDVLDDGDVAALQESFTAALRGALGPAVPRYRRDLSSAANRIAVTIEDLDDLKEGVAILVRVANDSTGPVTFRLNTRPSVAVTRPDGKPLAGKALKRGQVIALVCPAGDDETKTMQLVGEGASVASTSRLYFGRDTGSANAYVIADADFDQPLTELKAGTLIAMQPGSTNTGPSTLQVGSLGTKAVVLGTGVPLPAGTIQTGCGTLLYFDGASLQVLASYGLYAGNYPAVDRPSITSPANNATGVSKTANVVGTPYYSLYGRPQAAMRIRIAADPDFTQVVHQGTLTGAVTSYPIPNGAIGDGVFYPQIAYQNDRGFWSDWSPAIKFSTTGTSNTVAKPVNINPAANEPAAPVRPLLTCSAFAVTGGSDTQDKLEVRIARDAGMQNIVYAPTASSTETNQHQVGQDLDPQIDFYFDMRQHGATYGWSERSTPTRFRTQGRPSRPVVTKPVDGAGNVSLHPTLVGSAYNSPSGLAQAARRYRIRTYPGFAAVYDSGDDASSLTSKSLAAGTLGFDAQLIVDIRDKDASGAYSDWSVGNVFRTTAMTEINDIFAVTLFTGTNAAQTVTTGVDLASKGGSVKFRPRRGLDNTKPNPSPRFQQFSTVFGPRVSLDANARGGANYQTAPAGSGLTAFGSSGFTLGQSYLTENEAASPIVAFTHAHYPKFYQSLMVPSGTETVDLSVLQVVGDVHVYYRTADPFLFSYRGWHIALGNNKNTYPTETKAVTSDAQLTVDSDAVLHIKTPTSGMFIEAWAHDDSPNGLIQCKSFVTDNSGRASVYLGWKPQFIEMFAVTGGHWMDVDSTRGMGSGPEYILYREDALSEFVVSLLSVSETGFAIDNSANTLKANTQYIFRAIRAAAD